MRVNYDSWPNIALGQLFYIMTYYYKPFLFFSLFSFVVFTAIIMIDGSSSMNLYSISVQALGIIFTGLLFRDLIIKHSPVYNEILVKKYSVFYLLNHVDKKSGKNLVVFILGTILMMGFLNAWLIIYYKTNIDENQKSLLSIIFFSTLGITQFGGWFFQTVLIYMLAVVFGAKKTFGFYLRVVGISYIGFMLLSIVTLILNYFYIPDHVSLQEFNELIKINPVYVIVGKGGEFLALSMIGAGIANYEEFTPLKSLLIGCVPSFLLLLFSELFKSLF